MMENIQGAELGAEVLEGHKHVRDLIVYDGPLLSHFENDRGDHFLYYWCNGDDKSNRWMVLRIGESSILRLVNGLLPLDDLIPMGSRDGYVYIVDLNAEARPASVKLVWPTMLPSTYRPRQGHLIRPEFMEIATTDFAVLMDGQWSIENLRTFPEKFNNVYATIYATNTYPKPHEERLPWRGGFSVMHFRNWALSIIPKDIRPRVSALSYQSPGFMRFELDVATADDVTRCVRAFNEKQSEIRPIYEEVAAFIRRNGLNSIENSYDERWLQYERNLIVFARLLIEKFNCLDVELFMATFQRPFEAAKVAMSFYRSVKELSNFEAEHLVTFPTPAVIVS